MTSFGRSSMSTPPVRADAAACAGRDRPETHIDYPRYGHIWITAGNGTRWCEECGLVVSPGEVAGHFDAPPCVKERER